MMERVQLVGNCSMLNIEAGIYDVTQQRQEGKEKVLQRMTDAN